MAFTRLPMDEIERRRLASVEAVKELQRDQFARWYQERCDSFYWKHGRCCAGCDHWASEQGDIGICTDAPIMSGVDVLRSTGIQWSSLVVPPGQPFTRHDHVCGAFRDEFDWSSLDEDYLVRIGAPVLTALRETEDRSDG